MTMVEKKGCGKPCDCPSYRDHLLSITVSSSAMPTRKPEVAATTAREKEMTRDLPAYKRLRDQGYQPPRTRGASDLETRAEAAYEIERGTVDDPAVRRETEALLADSPGLK